MKLQIDTVAKTISLEENVKISELITTLKRLFPGGEWKDYQLKTGGIINWTSPIIIQEWQPYHYPVFSPGWAWPTITCDASGTGSTNISTPVMQSTTVSTPSVGGIYCIDAATKN